VECIFRQLSFACRDIGVSLCGGHTEITQDIDRAIVVGAMIGEVKKVLSLPPTAQSQAMTYSSQKLWLLRVHPSLPVKKEKTLMLFLAWISFRSARGS
jgi:hypothetical protein